MTFERQLRLRSQRYDVRTNRCDSIRVEQSDMEHSRKQASGLHHNTNELPHLIGCGCEIFIARRSILLVHNRKSYNIYNYITEIKLGTKKAMKSCV